LLVLLNPPHFYYLKELHLRVNLSKSFVLLTIFQAGAFHPPTQSSNVFIAISISFSGGFTQTAAHKQFIRLVRMKISFN
jgi:hypothetical protein